MQKKETEIQDIFQCTQDEIDRFLFAEEAEQTNDR
jgi:hypothetical protein